MFTGIITDIGTVKTVTRGQEASLAQRAGNAKVPDAMFEIACAYDPDTIDIGASIALSGACMTVTRKAKTDTGCTFTVDVSDESLSKTTLGSWSAGTPINLERAMKVGDEYGGHMVSGHVDSRAVLTGLEPLAGSLIMTFTAPKDLLFGIAPKGSVTIDGVSLTVNTVSGQEFTVNIIAHTAAVTTLGKIALNDEINLEIDTIARYVARYMDHMKAIGA
ncbi:MAG: riboflavin synthase [Robiginitomaculum sp.]